MSIFTQLRRPESHQYIHIGPFIIEASSKTTGGGSSPFFFFSLSEAECTKLNAYFQKITTLEPGPFIPSGTVLQCHPVNFLNERRPYFQSIDRWGVTKVQNANASTRRICCHVPRPAFGRHCHGACWEPSLPHLCDCWRRDAE